MMRRSFVLFAALLLSLPALADDVALLAVLGNKAMLKINGKRQVLAVGQQLGSVKLVRLDSDSVMAQIGPSVRTLRLGEGYVSQDVSQTDGHGSLTLAVDAAGNFFTDLRINGQLERGLIDTGASSLSMPEQIAVRMHIDYKGGRQTAVKTANGLAKVWIVNLPRIELGHIPLYAVDVAVLENSGFDMVLIGSNVLNRFQMKRDNSTLTLVKK